jgi:hypothetical protein
MHLRALRLLAGIAALGATRAASAAPFTVLAGRIDGVVAAGGGVAVLRAGEVVLLDGDGRVVGGCRSAQVASAAPRRDGTTLSREEVLHEAGFSDEDASSEAEELLEDEGIDEPTRRHPPSMNATAPRALTLADAPDAAWVGTTDGLWRLDARDGSCAPMGLAGRPVTLVAARGPHVVAVAGATVWRSRDAGTTFDVATVLTSTGQALALAADGETALVADDDGVVEIGAAPDRRRVLEGRVDALVACGADVVALGEDGVYRLDGDGGASRAGPRPPVRALACVSSAGPGLVAAGVGVWSSADGSAWSEEPAALGRSFLAVAQAAGRAWLATADGLVLLSAHEEKDEEKNEARNEVRNEEENQENADPAVEAPRRPRLERKRTMPAWAGLLPHVALVYDEWSESTGRAGWRFWVRLTVSLGARWQRNETQNVEDLR